MPRRSPPVVEPPVKLKDMSIAEIREQFAQGDQPVTNHVLHQMRRDPRRGVRQLYRTLKRRSEKEREEQQRLEGLLNFERVLWRAGITRLAGVDEAGVGCLAGPVVAAAVVFPPETFIDGVDDSKKLAPDVRETLAHQIRDRASGVGIGVASPREIDAINVYQATFLAMRRAVADLPEAPEHVLVDAREIPDVPHPQNAFTKGDGLNFTIAAASIIAKTHRDAMMTAMDGEYPEYGFARHKGYATPEHQEAIQRHGPCTLHRTSYTYLRELRGEYSETFYELMAALDEAEGRRALRHLEDQLADLADELPEEEYRKLRLTLRRRWNTLTSV